MSLEIYTWKSGSKGLGFTKPVKSMLFGGNVGHAALELTFPADAKGDELAKNTRRYRVFQLANAQKSFRKNRKTAVINQKNKLFTLCILAGGQAIPMVITLTVTEKIWSQNGAMNQLLKLNRKYRSIYMEKILPPLIKPMSREY